MSNLLDHVEKASSTVVRRDIAEYINKAANQGLRIAITKHGTPVAAIVPFADLATLETLDSQALETVELPENISDIESAKGIPISKLLDPVKFPVIEDEPLDVPMPQIIGGPYPITKDPTDMAASAKGSAVGGTMLPAAGKVPAYAVAASAHEAQKKAAFLFGAISGRLGAANLTPSPQMQAIIDETIQDTFDSAVFPNLPSSLATRGTM